MLGFFRHSVDLKMFQNLWREYMVNTGPDCQHVFAGTREKKTKKKLYPKLRNSALIHVVWQQSGRKEDGPPLCLHSRGDTGNGSTPISTLPTPYLPSQRASLGLGDGAGERECYSLKNEGLIWRSTFMCILYGTQKRCCFKEVCHETHNKCTIWTTFERAVQWRYVLSHWGTAVTTLRLQNIFIFPKCHSTHRTLTPPLLSLHYRSLSCVLDINLLSHTWFARVSYYSFDHMLQYIKVTHFYTVQFTYFLFCFL